MATYTPHTDKDLSEMLEVIGVKSVSDLFADVPKDMLKSVDIPLGQSEMETEIALNKLADKNKVYRVRLMGAGAYDHYIPAVVREITSRSEFVTAYTPYQAEISQGILQGIYEYQSEICALTGMDVCNASLYDGATAIAEAADMLSEVKKEVLVLETINPEYLAVLKTYAFPKNLKITMVKSRGGLTSVEDLKSKLNDNVACCIAQSPNYYGLIENMDEISLAAKEKAAKFVYVFNPIAAALLKTPKESGADVAVAEGQPLGMPLSYGGPYLGILTCTKALSRKMPGRVVGETVDKDGKRAFVLTMQAREQHIRREKALSSICSNEALCALTAAVYLATVGKSLKEIAKRNIDNAHYFADKLSRLNGVTLKYRGEFFNEFVTVVPDSYKILSKLDEKGILGGLDLCDNEILWCATEKLSVEDLDEAAEIIGGAL